MSMVRQFPSSLAGALGVLLAALAASSCRTRPADCVRGPLVDTAGEAAEKLRIERQWLAIQGKLDSSEATPSGVESGRSATGSLEAAVARYRDSLADQGGVLVSRSGCIDWSSTWREGRVDRAALVTAWLRASGESGIGVVEWSPLDSSASGLRLRTMFTRPGTDGGTLDSAVLHLSASEVRRDRTGTPTVP